MIPWDFLNESIQQLVTAALKFFSQRVVSPFYHCSLNSEQKAAAVFLQ